MDGIRKFQTGEDAFAPLTMPEGTEGLSSHDLSLPSMSGSTLKTAQEAGNVVASPLDHLKVKNMSGAQKRRLKREELRKKYGTVPSRRALSGTPAAKRPRSIPGSEGANHYQNCNDTHRMAIHPPDYPDEKLTQETIEKLEDMMLLGIEEALESENGLQLHFQGHPYIEDGAYFVVCVNSTTRKWLETAVVKMDVGQPLQVSEAKNVVRTARVLCHVSPPSNRLEVSRILRALERQNPEFKATQWRTLRKQDTESCLKLTFYIPEREAMLLRDRGQRLYLMLGTANFIILSSALSNNKQAKSSDKAAEAVNVRTGHVNNCPVNPDSKTAKLQINLQALCSNYTLCQPLTTQGKDWRVARQNGPDLERVARQNSPDFERVARQNSPDFERVARQNSPDFKREARQNSPDFKREARQNSQDFKRVARQNSPDFKKVARQNSPDFERVARQNSSDFERVARQNSPDFKREARQNSQDFKRVARQNSPDFKREARQNSQDFKRVARQNSPDFKRVARQNSPDFERVARQNSLDFEREARQNSPDFERVARQNGPDLKRVARQNSPDLESAIYSAYDSIHQHSTPAPLTHMPSQQELSRKRSRPNESTTRSNTRWSSPDRWDNDLSHRLTERDCTVTTYPYSEWVPVDADKQSYRKSGDETRENDGSSVTAYHRRQVSRRCTGRQTGPRFKTRFWNFGPSQT